MWSLTSCKTEIDQSVLDLACPAASRSAAEAEPPSREMPCMPRGRASCRRSRLSWTASRRSVSTPTVSCGAHYQGHPAVHGLNTHGNDGSQYRHNGAPCSPCRSSRLRCTVCNLFSEGPQRRPQPHQCSECIAFVDRCEVGTGDPSDEGAQVDEWQHTWCPSAPVSCTKLP